MARLYVIYRKGRRDSSSTALAQTFMMIRAKRGRNQPYTVTGETMTWCLPCGTKTARHALTARDR